MREMMLHRLQYRNFGTHQTLLGNFVVDADGEPDNLPDPANERGGARWFTCASREPAPGPVGRGHALARPHEPLDGLAALDGSGNEALGIFGRQPFRVPGHPLRGRLSDDPPGTLRAETALVEGTANNGSTRWGDYAAMSVDPETTARSGSPRCTHR